MQIPLSEMEFYRQAARKRAAARRTQIELRRKRGLAVARKAADILKREFGVSQVMIFGSLLHPTLFHMHSDIDLAVVDIKALYRAVSRLMDIDPEFQIDLVPMEDVSAELRSVIEKEGVEL